MVWARKDEGAWSIRKGEYNKGEDPLAHAKREFSEELGLAGPEDAEYIAPGEAKQPSGKVVTCWAVVGNLDVTTIQSNLFETEWPKGSGQFKQFPKVDKAGWFPLKVARLKWLKGHVVFLDPLKTHLQSIGTNVEESPLEPPTLF